MTRSGIRSILTRAALGVALVAAALSLPPSRLAADNVKTDAEPKERVKTFWKTLDDVVADLDKSASDADRLKVKKFLLHVAWHEGASLKERKQLKDGPARSFFQFEPPAAKDAVQYAKSKGWLDRLASSSGEKAEAVEAAGQALPGTGTKWPEGSPIEKHLLGSDLFGAYLARIAFKKVPEGIPATNQGHAEYWAKHWKRKFDNEEQKAKQIEAFRKAADEVDKLIP